MIEDATNGDKIIGVLRSIASNPEVSSPTKEVAQFVLDDINLEKPVCRLASLMVICQRIFEEHLEALNEMIRQIVKTKQDSSAS
jgi:uncharacterized protein with PhoU and TrkA domain